MTSRSTPERVATSTPRPLRGPAAGHGWRPPTWVPLAFVAAAILAQIWWPLAHGDARVAATLAVVALFSATSVTHAWTRCGGRWAIVYAATAIVLGFAVEFVGVHTGWPFSEYAYTDVLQPQLAGVPLVVPLAWTMMAWPALLVGRTLIPGPGRAGPATRIALWAAIGAWALASWDLFLDPQMVAERYWVWANAEPHLPGIPGIPLANYAGWLLTAVVMIGALIALARVVLSGSDGAASPHAQPRPAPLSWPADAPVIVAYLWTWLGGVVANAFFLGRPSVALVGGIGMALVGVPLIVGLARQ